MTFTTEPAEFARYIHDVRISRSDAFIYLYVNFAVKWLTLFSHEVEDGLVVLSFGTRREDDTRSAVWPPAAPWPTAPEYVRVRIRLGLGEQARMVSGVMGR